MHSDETRQQYDQMIRRHLRVIGSADARMKKYRREYFRLLPGQATPNAQTLRVELALTLPPSKSNTLTIIGELRKLSNFNL